VLISYIRRVITNKIILNKDTIFYPLTHPQKRIWYIEKIYPGTSLYNIGGPIRIRGAVDFGILEECINVLVKRNDGLRLRFVEEQGEVKQYVSNFKRIKLDYMDFSKYEDPETEYKAWVEEVAKKAFVIENENLFYFALFKISDNDNGYLVKFHHIISDGWSMNIMTNQICDNYIKLLEGEDIENSSEGAYSYIEYIDNEKKYLSSKRFLKNKLFWNEKFKVLPEIFLNKSSDIIEGKRKTVELNAELSSEIRGFVADNKCSLNTFFVTLFLLYLNKTTQQEDIVIGTPVLNRSGKKEKSMFGMFTSTMPFRFAIDDNASVLSTIAKVNEELMECFFNQRYPYDLLVQDLELKKRGYDNLFNVCVNYYNTKLSSNLNGAEIENIEFYNGNQAYSLQLVIKDWSDSGCLKLDFDYKSRDYSGEQIGEMFIRLIYLINQIIKNPCEIVGKLNLLPEAERNKLLYDFNASEAEYPKDKTICQLFEEQVEKSPDKVAISFHKDELTFSELNKKANQLARFLDKKGVKRETIIGLLTTHSMETVIGILGILKAGGAYLPIDPGYPCDRISYMLEDSGSSILLVNMELPEGVSFSGETINLHNQSLYSGENSNLKEGNKPDDLVYVIYTSGSTGKPKGTMIEHQGLVNYIWWAKKMYVKNEEVFPLYSSLAFDLTVTSIFTPLITGSRMIVYSDNNEEDEYVLYRIMKESKATIVKLTPSHLSLLKDMDNTNSSVRRFIVGGEDLKVSLAKDIHESFDGNIEIFNEYGPTETVVGCMIYKYDYENDVEISVPIGIPADNVQIYILDKNLNPIPSNTVGEMYISGDGVARGYLNRLELTQERFVANPFINGRRMYKTGDLARFKGEIIEYIGRADQQVKIHGYRIEPGEIEKYLVTHEAIKDAVVVDIEDGKNGKYLCAYIVKKAEVSINELKDLLLRYLPDYMIPLHFIELEEIPLTPNGKVNRVLLPKPEANDMEDIDFVLCKNEKENVLVESICEVLNMERVSVRQNFYHIGGDSIKAIQIASKLSDKGFKIKVKDILAYPIIEEMAVCAEYGSGMIIDQQPSQGSIKHTPITKWFVSQGFSEPNHYNQSVLLSLKQDIDCSWFEHILDELIKHHDSLRINMNPVSRELFYNNELLNRHNKIVVYDLSSCGRDEQDKSISTIGAQLKSGLDIERDIALKACIFDLGQRGKLLLMTANHLLVDGVSWRIILEDVYSLYQQLAEGKGINLPRKTHSYQTWASELEEYAEKIENEMDYWKTVNQCEFLFKTDFDLGEDTYDNTVTLTQSLTEAQTLGLLTNANIPFTTKPMELILYALVSAIREFTGLSDVAFELESHGRENINENLDISRTVGWFTGIYPVRLDIGVCEGIGSGIKTIKEQLRTIPNNGIGYGILKYIMNKEIDNNTKYLRFNYLGGFDDVAENDLFELSPEYSGSEYGDKNLMTSLIDINVIVVNKKLNISLTYSINKFEKASMLSFIEKFAGNLNSTISYCLENQSKEFTPSDFDTVDILQEDIENLFI
jgi:amino acid adenylation domain-containing protein/non-ribosomal peptide synthase protein (TIGR01720 family)